MHKCNSLKNRFALNYDQSLIIIIILPIGKFFCKKVNYTKCILHMNPSGNLIFPESFYTEKSCSWKLFLHLFHSNSIYYISNIRFFFHKGSEVSFFLFLPLLSVKFSFWVLHFRNYSMNGSIKYILYIVIYTAMGYISTPRME